ncbi:MAG: HEPN domain-containing protein [Candidatus Micrarchaeota archaeon]
MDSKLKRCIDERKIVQIPLQPDLVQKEIDAAIFDLKTAEESFSEGNHKWATVQAYYSMFHSAKALVLSKGYREKSHVCLSIALKSLLVDKNLLEQSHYEHFRDCMELREDADYGLIYSRHSAETVIGWAKEFLEAARKVIG